MCSARSVEGKRCPGVNTLWESPWKGWVLALNLARRAAWGHSLAGEDCGTHTSNVSSFSSIPLFCFSFGY